MALPSPKRGPRFGTPYRWAEGDTFIGGNARSVWVYHKIPTTPLDSEDPGTVYEAGDRLRRILLGLGETIQRPVVHSRALAAVGRRVHIVVITWEDRLAPPPSMPGRQARWLLENFDDQGGYLVPQRAVYFGVEAKIKGTAGVARTVLSGMREMFFGEDVNLAPYQTDIADIRRILKAHRGVPITDADRRQLTAWYSGGRATDMAMAEDTSCIWPDPDSFAARRGIRIGDPIEMAGVVTFGHGDPPVWVRHGERWAEAALDHPKGPCVLSIRGELVHSEVARLRSRDAQRRILSDLEEHDKTLDLPKAELEERAALAKQVEEYYRVDPEPPLTEVSIICGRRISPDEEATDTYLDALGNYDIEIKPLEHRQIWALEETLPTSPRRVSPHLQDFNLNAVAHSGVMAFSALGDDEGLYVGLSLPNLTPVWLDPKRASSGQAANQSPVVGIFGDPGSGKAQPLDAKILTPRGWTTMGEVAVGDQVIGVDGKAHRVLGVFPQGEKEIYRVTFSDGSRTECCEEHLWQVNTKVQLRRGQPKQVRTLADLRDDLTNADGERKWRIPVVAPIAFETKVLPLDPYLMGVLLGDGGMTASFVTLSSADSELLDEIRRVLPEGATLRHRANWDWGIVGADPRGSTIRHALGDLGLLGLRAHEKFIPPGYLKGSIAERVALLDGLSDEGEDHGARVITATSTPLISDVVALVESLGETASVRRKGGEGAEVSFSLASAALSHDIEWTATEGMPLHPYVMGVVLSRCCLRSASLGATMSLSQQEMVRPLIPAHDALRSHADQPTATYFASAVRPAERNPVLRAIKDLGLLGKKSVEKCIPESYLLGDVSQRIALLQGLMDTDGSLEQSVVFSTSSGQLADDVEFLVRSLGGIARRKVKPSSYMGSDGQRHSCHLSYRLTINLPKWIAPFRLSRKADPERALVHRYPPIRMIDSIESVGIKPAQCIMTDAPDGLYVTDDLIVTHNTFLLQSLAVQAALAGYCSIFVNPKSDDDLSPMARMTGGEVITLGDDNAEPGALDPFRYAPPRLAARLAAVNLLGLYRAEQNRRSLEADVLARFDRAAVAARCSMDLIETLAKDHKDLYAFATNLTASHPLVALTIATKEREPLSVSKGLTLIQFDRPLPLPTLVDPDKWEMEQAVAVSCLRMVLRGSLEILLRSEGRGFFATDEAWALLSWPEGLDFITRLGKEGRSQGITLALATHLIAEVAGRDLVGYLGRIFTGMLKDKVQAAAALSLCGMEATPERMEWLRTECGPEAPNPKRGTPAHPSTFLHRDLDGRHAPVMIAPYAEHIRAQFSTSSGDVRARRAQEKPKAPQPEKIQVAAGGDVA